MAERVPAEQLAVQDGRARVPQHPADRGDEPRGLLDTALMTRSVRPRLYFDVPHRASARISSTTSSSARSTMRSSTTGTVRTRIAHESFGYTPVMIEHLFDEALLARPRRTARDELLRRDGGEVHRGDRVKQAVTYTDNDRSSVAVHEAGHATVAHFLGQNRRLEVLSIIKRRGSSGCSPTATRRSGSRGRGPRSSRGSRSRSAGWLPRSSCSASPAPGPRTI